VSRSTERLQQWDTFGILYTEFVSLRCRFYIKKMGNSLRSVI